MDMAVKDLVRVLAPNPSPLTGPGTNTFVIGAAERVVIDPGPDHPGHLAAVMEAAGGRVSHILVTHPHLDHSAGARRLSQMSGAPVLAFGGVEDGRSPVMRRLAGTGLVGGGDGLDAGFDPDQRLADGALLTTPAGNIEALHTPGHSGAHLSFAWRDVVFTGDLVMGWSTTLISPPDGDLTDYFRSLARLEHHGAAMFLPAHGEPVPDPARRIAELTTHRRQRTAQILAALTEAPGDADSLARRIYDLPPSLHPAASRNVLAHLIALHALGAVETEREITARSFFSSA
ncbi:hydroxyacylglutathione hydrolase [Paracoccus tibetensis]|uniref:Hydroxyacylglutathione hydrolase n=2 Tax=Paracoccus tibetensis TaxID=336292 RepID=A0A1G5CXJ1_9RHOB|nr:hydroxyacylglutathione hydrolase [Paracoccus tibetensis]